MTKEATFQVFRGDSSGGEFQEYKVPVEEGMVVLDAMHYIQGFHDEEFAVRWNCKAAKCGSCSGEVNGKVSLMCKTRLDDLDLNEPVQVSPMKTFPVIKDLVTDVSWNYEVNKKIKAFTPANDNVDEWVYYQEDVDRSQEFRKCIECFCCQDVCHVLRNSDKKATDTEFGFSGPRFMVRTAGLEMHPMDTANRLQQVKEEGGIGFCNITKCCTEVCPEEIHITDNAIIPLKERVADEYYDPVMWLLKKVGLVKSK